MKKYLFTLLISASALFLFENAKAQGRTDTSPENALPRPIISPSPEAGALGKYGDVPIGLFKGMPNIDIPFYTLTKGDISVPVSINYSSSGIKVDEISTNIGLSWTLMAGGAITASAVDKNDLSPSYSRNVSINLATFSPNSGNISSPDYLFAKSYVGAHTAADLEPDVFTYSFCGRSGKFFFDTDVQVGHTIPASTVKINRTSSGFTITDERGTRFLFTTLETSFVTDSCTIGATPRETGSGQSTYYLTQIVDNKGNAVNFSYENSDYYYSQGIEEAQYYSQLTGECGLLTSHNTRCIKVQTVAGRRIRMISAADNSVSITFNYSATAREDLISLAGTPHAASSLDQVVVRAGTRVIKTISLGHDYFKADGYDTAPNSIQRALQCRLRLTTVTESGKQPYTFRYNESQRFPARLQAGSDYWGYYNGGGGNGTNIPYVYQLNNPGRYMEPNPDFTPVGLLTNIRYPTGGSTTLYYEQNDTYVQDSENDMVWMSKGCVGYPPHSSDTCLVHLDYNVNEPTINYNLQLNGHDNGFGSIDGPGGIHLEFAGHGSLTLNQPGYLTILPAGNYTFVVENNTPGPGRTSLDISWLHSVTSTAWVHKLMGGVRIAKTIDTPVTGAPVRKFYRYTLSDTSQATSLFYKAISPSNYDYPYHTYHIGLDGGVIQCDYSVLHSAPIPLVGQGDRNDYGYTKVTVLTDSLGTQGKSIHYFSRGLRDFQQANGITDQTWMAGLERAQEDFLYNPTLQKYVISRRVKNTYAVNLSAAYFADNTNPLLPPNQFSVYGLKLTQESPEFVKQQGVIPAVFKVERYPVVSAWYYQSGTTQTLFNTADTTKFVTTTTNSYFDNPAHQQATRTVSGNSDGKVITSITTYPDDYSAGTAFLDSMRTNHQIAIPIEQVSYMNDGTSTNIVSGKLTQFLPGGKALPLSSYNFESLAPIALTAFKFSDRPTGTLPYGTTPAAFAMDSRYVPKLTYNSYDNAGNPLTLTLSNGMSESYIWDYKKEYPIARVTNADSLSIAYTSFEADGKGHWTISSTVRDTTSAKTGRSSLNAASWTLGKGGLSSAQTYVVSYWSKSAAAFSVSGTTTTGYPVTGNTTKGWIYHEHRVTGVTAITVTGSGSVDEVRLYPAGGQMTTYTYDPMIGMTSTTDAKSLTTDFEYDGFQRLLNARDQDGNILKNYSYNYAPQGAIWQNTAAAPRCVTASDGSNTGEQQIQQVDTNPYSLTYNQTQWISNGTNTSACPLPTIVYVRMTVGTTTTTNGITSKTYVFRSYSDAGCTVLVNVPASITVKYQFVKTSEYDDHRTPNPVVTTLNYTATIASGTSQATSGSLVDSGCSGIACYTGGVTLKPGTGYNVYTP